MAAGKLDSVSKIRREAERFGVLPVHREADKRGLSPEMLLYKEHRVPTPSPGILKRKINVSLDEDMYGRLMQFAWSKRSHHAELIRTFIEWGLEEWES